MQMRKIKKKIKQMIGIGFFITIRNLTVINNRVLYIFEQKTQESRCVFFFEVAQQLICTAMNVSYLALPTADTTYVTFRMEVVFHVNQDGTENTVR